MNRKQLAVTALVLLSLCTVIGVYAGTVGVNDLFGFTNGYGFTDLNSTNVNAGTEFYRGGFNYTATIEGLIAASAGLNPFDQDLNTTDPVTFASVNATIEYYRGPLNYTTWLLGKADGGGVPYDQGLNTTENVSFESVNATDEFYRNGANYTAEIEALIAAGPGGGVGNYSTASRNSGADVGPRQTINFIEGANITITVADDGPGNEIDVTITSTGGGGSNDLPFYHAVVSSNASNTGRPRYFITDGHDDQVQINQAINYTVNGYAQDRVTVFVEPGFYNISEPIRIDNFYPKNGTMIAYGAEFWLEKDRPNGQASDFYYHIMMYNLRSPLVGFRLYGGEFNGNKANVPRGAINSGEALIYIVGEGHDVIIKDVVVRAGNMRGIQTKASSGDYWDVHYYDCEAWDNDIDGLKFSIAQGAFKQLYDSTIEGCVVGGDTGDIGIVTFDNNDSGLLHNIGIFDSTIHELYGTYDGGIGSGKVAIKLESTSRNCVIDGFVIYEADKGIGLNDGGAGTGAAFKGRHQVSNGVIFMTDNVTHPVHPLGTIGISIVSDYNTISGVTIIGTGIASERLINVDGDHNTLIGLRLENGTEGIEFDAAQYCQLLGGQSWNNGVGIELKQGADYTMITGWTFDDTLGIEVDAGNVNSTIIMGDFRECTEDVNDAGTTTMWRFNWDASGNWHEDTTPDD